MTPELVGYTLLLLVGLFVAQEIFHRYPKFALGFFSVATIIWFPCWILVIGGEDWFLVTKVLSVISGLRVLSIFRNTRLGLHKNLLKWTTYLFLVINIFEAVTRDVASGHVANYFNALAGILLIITLKKMDSIQINTKDKSKDLSWNGMTLGWIIGYTLWNWVFVYLNLGFQGAVLHVAVLGSALVIGFTSKARWLQARAATLGLYFIVFHSWPHLASRLIVGGTDPQYGVVLALIPFGFMLGYVLDFAQKRFKTPGFSA